MSDFTALAALTTPPGAALAANLLAFGRLLRRAGCRSGRAETLAAAEALQLVDIGDRRQVHAALRAVMVRRHADFDVFDQAFLLFWRDPEARRNAAAMAMLDGFKDRQKPPPASRRVSEALTPPAQPSQQPPREPEEKPPIEVAMTVSRARAPAGDGFRAMSAAEINDAKREIRKLVLPLDARPTRRFRPDPMGPVVDLRATIRASLHEGGEILTLARKRRVPGRRRWSALCDISGSMARYRAVLLHFLHAVTNDRDRVHSFLFGTRLTNVTRQLKSRDAEVAFELVSHIVPDWSGRHADRRLLDSFNRQWSRRVLGQGAVVLLITDGLDREVARGPGRARDRPAAQFLPPADLAEPPVAVRGLPAQIHRASGRCCRMSTSSARCIICRACGRWWRR